MSKILKNILCISMFLVVSCTSFVFAFSDIENHWAKNSIEELTERGVLNGFEDGTFRPNANVTREQFAKILVESLELKETNIDVEFKDVSSNRWSHEYIKIASQYLTGYRYNDGLRFKPTESSVREDVAVAVVLASGLGGETPNYDLLDQFSDKNEISENLKKYVAIAVEHEIMRGKGGYFDPQGNLTRAEVSQLLLNISDKVVIDEVEFDEEKIFKKISSIKKWINIEEADDGQLKVDGREIELIAWDGQDRHSYYWYRISDNLNKKSNIIEIKVPVEDIKVDADFFDVNIYAQVIEDKYIVLRAGAKGIYTSEVRVYDENLEFIQSFIMEEEEDKLDLVMFSAFRSEMGGLQESVTVAQVTSKGEEAIRGNSRSNAQLYNFVARGGYSILTSDTEGDKKWLVQSDAKVVPCTMIDPKYAEETLGIELPSRRVDTYKGENQQVSYFVTPEGRVFCWPPYEYDGKSYVSASVTVKDENGKELMDTKATKLSTVTIYFEDTNETVKVSNSSNGKATIYERGSKDAGGIGVWYPKAGKVLGIDFSEYDNTKVVDSYIQHGDVNRDGVVDKKDVDELEDVIYVTRDFDSIDNNRADVNFDRKLTELDYLILDNYVFSKRITELPHKCTTYTIKYNQKDEEDHRKVLTCACKIVLLKEVQEHDFSNGDCICGFEEPTSLVSDIDGTIYEDAVNELIELEIMNGFADGNFYPEKIITRAELAKLLVIVDGLEDIAKNFKGNSLFDDVPNAHWAKGYIYTAVKYGFMSGYPDETFAPDQPVKYSEAITYILRQLGYQNVIESTGTWPTNYLTKARELGLLDNVKYSSYNNNVTRGNIAILLYNSLDIDKWVVKIVKYGDVNGDGNVTVQDRMILARYLENWEGYTIDEANSDVNLDGKVDEIDLEILARYFSGWVGFEKLPYSGEI